MALHPSTALRACVGAKESRLFSTDSNDRIEAREFATGKVLWTVEAKGEVVHCDDEVVLTAHVTPKGLTLYGLAVADGKEQWAHNHKLPSWVDDENLSVTAWKDQRCYGVAWSAQTSWRGGYPPSDREERDARREATGSFVVAPGGKTFEVQGHPFKAAEIPTSIQKDFPGQQGRITLDGAHVRFEDGAATKVVHLKTKAIRTYPIRLGSAASRLYQTRHGAALLIETISERREDQQEYHYIKARCWDEQGQNLWSAELYRHLVPEPVP